MEEVGAGGRVCIFEELVQDDTSEKRALDDTSKEPALDDTSEDRALADLKPPQGWTRESRTKEGWTEPVGTTERGEGALRFPEQHPTLSDPTPCLAVPDVFPAHPQPRCRGWSSTPHSHRLLLAPSWWVVKMSKKV